MKYFFLIIAFPFYFLEVNAQANPIQYSVAQKPWPAGLGNHRAVIQVGKPSPAVRLRLTWRLHDQQPDKKRFLIMDAITGDTVNNVYRIDVNNEHCDVTFGPVTKTGKYYFYYMPYKPDPNWGYFRYGYLSPNEPDPNWIKGNQLSDSENLSRLPQATCNEIQARTNFDSFYPMEIIPTSEEKNEFLSNHKDDYLVFPESRNFPIRMKDNVPLKWIKEGPQSVFKGEADRNEYYTFQLGIYAAGSDIGNIRIAFSDLKGPEVIPSGKITCFNTGGTDPYGKPFAKTVDVAKGHVQALWMGVDIAPDIKPGIYKGNMTISATGKNSKTIPLQLRITKNYLANRGDDESWRYSRLRWLNSSAGTSDKPTAPFTAIKSEKDDHYSLSDKEIFLTPNALPASVNVSGTNVLAGPVRYIVSGEDFEPSKFTVDSRNEGNIEGSWTSRSKNFTLYGKWTLQFDGYIEYIIQLKALKDVELKDFRLEIPYEKEVAKYMMGMGLPGSTVPYTLDSKWDGPHDSFWMGNTYGGLYCELLGSSYHGPLLNLYKPSFPASWYNENKGGFSVRSNDHSVVATVYSGSRFFNKGEEISYGFDFIVTPVKKLNIRSQFTDRYYHDGANPGPDSTAIAAGVKVINIHHGNKYNPFINYPFIMKKEMKDFADLWHKKGMKTKIYYTTRELTIHTSELWALQSFNHEIFSDGGGGGHPWLREHLIKGYAPAWYTPIEGDIGNVDIAIETASGNSRWYNFYVRGLAWLIENEHIDGVYLDDVAFGRHIIKRMREVMDSVKPGCLIDLHSNTGFSKGPATQYTAFFPYINKLWFGESFQYNNMPTANWLVETSGVPFGLMGDMLHGGGNPWRGMVYGMTTRLPWFTEGVTCDPKAIWKVWDDFGIADSKMVGYWDEHPVVETCNPNVLATAYVKSDKTLIAIASWADKPVNVKLRIDWKTLGLNPDKVKLIAPAIERFQPSMIFAPNDEIPLTPEKGWLLIAEKK